MSAVAVPLIFAGVVAASAALLGIVLPERRIPSLLAWAGSLASLLALWASATVLRTGHTFRATIWSIPSVGALGVSLDRLSALFLLLASVVILAASIFSADYLKSYLGRYNLRAFNAWYLLLAVTIAWIVIAGDVFGFLLAWEGMGITSYLLVNFEHERKGTAQAGYVMLAIGEAGFIAITIVLLFLAAKAGSLQFSAIAAEATSLSPAARWLVFLVSFFGFAVKAGLVPVNTWLPRAHPAAPANVSAILSGVILNLGLYGIVRVNLDLVAVGSVVAGLLVLIVGTISALVGILYATTEDDLKAVLAHSSIENIGIITAGLGAGMVFSASGMPVLSGMAYIAAFYHLINHSVYKALLFLGAGTVDHRTGTRSLDALGGVVRRMPWTAAAFLAGALSIAAMPPFNGFVSEWLTLQTFLRSAELSSIEVRIVFALCGAGLALTAALAVTCFVKAFAMGFLGVSRSESVQRASEAGASAIAPMVGLAVVCLLLGIFPTYVIASLNYVLPPIVRADASAALVPPFFAGAAGHEALPPAFVQDFHALGAQVGQRVAPGPGLVVLHQGGPANPVVFAAAPTYLAVVLAILLAVVLLVIAGIVGRGRAVVRRECWDGGLRRLLPEMTYTATGFSNPVRVIFQAIFRPTVVEDTRETVAEHFRTAIRREAASVHVVDRLLIGPGKMVMLNLANRAARMHQGRLNAYVGYALLTLVVVLVLSGVLQ